MDNRTEHIMEHIRDVGDYDDDDGYWDDDMMKNSLQRQQQYYLESCPPNIKDLQINLFVRDWNASGPTRPFYTRVEAQASCDSWQPGAGGSPGTGEVTIEVRIKWLTQLW